MSVVDGITPGCGDFLGKFDDIQTGAEGVKKSLGKMDNLSEVLSGLEKKVESANTEEIKTAMNGIKNSSKALNPAEIAKTAKKLKGAATSFKPGGGINKVSGFAHILKVAFKKAANKMKNPKYWFIIGAVGFVGYLLKNRVLNPDDEYVQPITIAGVTTLLLKPIFVPKSSLQTAEKKFDWDKNGELDEDEKTALGLYKKSMARQAEEKEKAELLKRFDVNQDGNFDDVEKASMEAYHVEQKKIEEELEKKFDFDKNGELSAKERAAMAAYIKAQQNNTGKEEE